MIQDFIILIKKNLTPDLLKPAYRSLNENNPMYGHCYVAAEALFHLVKDIKLYPYHGKDSNGITHWWLCDSCGNIYDPTAEQYTSINKVPPYENGKRGTFLTKDPSMRAAELIRRVRESS